MGKVKTYHFYTLFEFDGDTDSFEVTADRTDPNNVSSTKVFNDGVTATHQ